MKRQSMSFVVIAVAATLLTSACASSRQPVVLGEKDAGRLVEIDVGQRLTVRLPSNATTGFRWQVADPGPVMQVGESVYDAPEERDVVGAGGTETFTFEADAPGSGDLKLEYRRPWEKGVRAEKTWTVTIRAR